MYSTVPFEYCIQYTVYIRDRDHLNNCEYLSSCGNRFVNIYNNNNNNNDTDTTPTQTSLTPSPRVHRPVFDLLNSQHLVPHTDVQNYI